MGVTITDWNNFSFDTKNKKSFFVLSDVHGNSVLLDKLLKQYDSRLPLVCLGDTGDRGEDSYGCFCRLNGIENKILIYGNHDLFLKHSIRGNESAKWLWYKNGGTEFMRSLPEKKIPDFIVAMADSMKLYYRSGNLLFIHAGINPYDPLEENLSVPEEMAFDLDKYSEWEIMQHPTWIRGKFLCYPHKILDVNNERLMIIHGHTPDTNGPIVEQNHINIDVGSYGSKPKLAAIEIRENEYRFIIAE